MRNLFNSMLVTAAFVSPSSVLAAPPEPTTYFGSVWSGVGFVLGYGNEAAYVKYACNDSDPGLGKECDGPPRQGLIRKFTEIVDSVITAAKFSTCAEVPTSGTKTVTTSTGDVTITFGTPTQKIPAAWKGGGTAFERRMDFSFIFADITIKSVVEASCTHDRSALMSMNMLIGSQAPGYERPINLWTGTTKDGNTIADVLTIERTSATGSVRSIYGYNVEINDTSKAYKLTGAHSVFFGGGSFAGIDVLNVNGNFNTHTASMRVKRFVVPMGNSDTGNAIDSAETISAMSGADDDLIAASTEFGLLTPTATTTAGPVGAAQGCMDFDADTVAPTSTAACTGLDFLTAVATPANDANGKYSAKWLLVSAKSKLVAVPSL